MTGPGGRSRRQPRFRSFEEAARAAGHCLWLETRLFEVLGAWAEVEEEPLVKLTLSTHSFRHAWHADVWRRRLPVVGSPQAGWRPEALAVPPSRPWGELMEALAATCRPEQSLERLVGMYQVVTPRLAASYDEHLATADPVSEGPTMRWLPLMVADTLSAQHEGERVVESVLAGRSGSSERVTQGPADADRAAAHRVTLQALLEQAGPVSPALWGRSGPVSPALWGRSGPVSPALWASGPVEGH